MLIDGWVRSRAR